MNSCKLKEAKHYLDSDLNNMGIYISELVDKDLKNFEKVKVVNKEAKYLKDKISNLLGEVYDKMKALELENEYLKKKNNALSKIVEYRDKIEELRKDL